METRKIGSLDVSVVGLGCNNFGRRLDAERTAGVIDAALDSGINFLDTADIYGAGQSEEFIGQALRSRRSQVILATKYSKRMEGQGQGAHPDYIRTAVEASLRRLNTDYIDLYQQHDPDPDVPIADTLGALNDLVQAGKVREIGCSNFSADQIRESDSAVENGAARFVSVQNRYSLLHRTPEAEVLPECRRLGLAFLPFFPLESGLLTGKFRQGQPIPENTRLSGNDKVLTEANLTLVEALIGYAEAHGHTILELAVSWLLMRPAVVSVIAGATKPEQVRANVGAAGWQMTEAELDEIEALIAAHRQ
ncbi:MAG: aldo/keto reductase [Anaerolineae bacterium]|nr:aldo/keto reductase [Anaerolineae bacterium]